MLKINFMFLLHCKKYNSFRSAAQLVVKKKIIQIKIVLLLFIIKLITPGIKIFIQGIFAKLKDCLCFYYFSIALRFHNINFIQVISLNYVEILHRAWCIICNIFLFNSTFKVRWARCNFCLLCQ